MKTLKDLPDLPGELYPYDHNDRLEILRVLSWQVGEAMRRKNLDGWGDIDTSFVALLTEFGFNDMQIQEAMSLVFTNEYDERRTSTMLGRTRTKQENGEVVRGTGSFIIKIKELGLKEIETLIIRLSHFTEKKDHNREHQKIVVLSKFIPRPFTEELLKQYSFIWEGARGLLWYYNKGKGIWEKHGEDMIKHILRHDFEALQDAMKKKTIIEEIASDVRECCYRPEGMPAPLLHFIPCRNGVYDLTKKELRQYSPDDHFSWQLPWNYNPEARADYLCNLIDTTLPPGGNITLYQLLAYCLWRGYPVQRFWILLGRGGNGKGLTMSIFTRLLGQENISNVSLDDIQDDRFAAAELHRKLANISGEVSYKDLENTSLLKQLTGGDTIDADRKYLSRIRFVNHAKLIFSTNSLPVTRDTTDAFFRRAHVIEFSRRFDMNPTIDVKLREDSPYMTTQFEGLLSITIKHLNSLRENSFRFSDEPTIEKAKVLYQRLSNPLARFIQENCTMTYDHEDFIYKHDFICRLNEWLRRHDSITMSQEKIGRNMTTLGIEQGRKASPSGDKSCPAYTGIKWAQFAGIARITEYSSTLPMEDKKKVTNYPEKSDTPVMDSSGLCIVDGAECSQS